MASTDSKPIPQKNVAYRIYLPIFDADGDLVTGAAGLDSEVSKDGGAFADCAAEATEIGSTGIYYLDLANTEMNADAVCVIVKTSTTGAKTTPIVMYPEEAGDIRVNATQLNGTGLTGRDIGASMLLSTGTGTGQLDFTSGVVKANLVQILATALTETAGQIAAAFKKFFDKGSPTGTINSLADAVPGAAGGGLIAGTNAATTITTALTTTFTGNLTGSVGSVSGNTNQTGDAYARLGAPAGASVSADVAAVRAAQVTRANTAQAGAAGTITLDASASAVDDFYNDQWVFITAGTGAGQARWISDYTGASKLAAITPNWITNPDNTSVFAVLPHGRGDVGGWLGATAPAMTGDAYARLGAPAGASVSADMAAVKAETATIVGQTGTTGVKVASGQITVKKNTAFSGFMFVMYDSSDHLTPKTGLTVTAQRSLDGAALGACANAVSELSNGIYKLDLAAGDLNGNNIMIRFTATGADATLVQIVTQP